MAAGILTGSPLFAAEAARFLPLLYLAVALVGGAILIYVVGRWRRSDAKLGPSASDELAQYRTLYEQGAISQEEYRKLRDLLGGALRKDLELAPKPAPRPAANTDIQAAPPPPSDETPPTTGIRPA